MKVILPVINNLNLPDKLAEGFHNNEFLCIYDSKLKSREWLSAEEISNVSGGLNSVLIQKEVFSIISLNITPMVLSMFNRNGIEVFKAQSIDISENINLFQAKQLKTFTAEESREIMACNSNSCSSCSSTCS